MSEFDPSQKYVSGGIKSQIQKQNQIKSYQNNSEILYNILKQARKNKEATDLNALKQRDGKCFCRKDSAYLEDNLRQLLSCLLI
jgi:conjugal transfer/entry exclusion protein